MRKFTLIFPVFLVSCVVLSSAPDCTFLSPEDGSEYQRGENIVVYVEADDDGTINEVRLYLDGIGIASFLEFPFNYTLETTEMEVGTHSLKAEVFDNYGKEGNTDVSFTITPGLPVVETLQPIVIFENAVVAAGTIIDDGGGTITEAGILWSTLPYDVAGQQERTAEIHEDDFSTTLTNLHYTTYYITAYAENEAGRSYGEELAVVVPEPEPDPALLADIF